MRNFSAFIFFKFELMSKTLNERAQYLLKSLIEKHISDGQPVGSKTLAEDTSLSLSSASIRNVLADLEEKGYISSIHTSSGRVPTEKGYRFFVDSLITVKPMHSSAVAQFQDQLSIGKNIQTLVNSASSLLSDLTHMVSVVSLPRKEHFILSQIEFLPLSPCRILAILVFNNKEVQNRVIQTSKDYSRDELIKAANYINETFLGYDLLTVRRKILKTMRSDKEKINELMKNAMSITDKALEDSSSKDAYVIAGETNLIDYASDSELNTLKKLFETFTQKQKMVDLLERCLQTQGIQIFIGKESNYSSLGNFSMITSTYAAEDEPIGVLGIIGPTRMPYDRIIPIVDITAKILTLTLNQ